jgi:hypothetical protein
MNAPKTKALYEEHKYFANMEEASEAICDFRDLCEKLESQNARMQESLEHIRDNGMTMTKEAIVGEASRFLSA